MAEWTRRYESQVAFADHDRQVTFGQWTRRANQYARWARRNGLAKGDVVALLFPHSVESIACWTGLARGGVVTTLLDASMSPADLTECLRICGARALLADARYYSIAREACRLNGFEGPVFLYGKSDCAGASDFPRLDLMLQGFSGRDIRPAEQVRFGEDADCVALIRHDTDREPALLCFSHRDVLRMMLETAAAIRPGGEIRLRGSTFQPIAMRALGAALASGQRFVINSSANPGRKFVVAIGERELRAWALEALRGKSRPHALLVEAANALPTFGLPSRTMLVLASPDGERGLQIVPRMQPDCPVSGRPRLRREAGIA